ncbi:hypothetical protein NLG97_g4827 [Lecanicillium saksenae]|uniref:Uncharacterized protein n=1 Tax=Lecanicillium saksenae TaxID=468837 RepID=A0ACC1QXD5_9HYPO|nr:hypothetical protein NLG97_g4827 [Lecanicillium saksenae]
MESQSSNPSYAQWHSPQSSRSAAACAFHSTQNTADRPSEPEPEHVVHMPGFSSDLFLSHYGTTPLAAETPFHGSMITGAGYDTAEPSAPDLHPSELDNIAPIIWGLLPQHPAFSKLPLNESQDAGTATAQGLSEAAGGVLNLVDRDSGACFPRLDLSTRQSLPGETASQELETTWYPEQADSDQQGGDGIWDFLRPSFATTSVAGESSLALRDDSSQASNVLLGQRHGFKATALICNHPSCTSKVVFKRPCDLQFRTVTAATVMVGNPECSRFRKTEKDMRRQTNKPSLAFIAIDYSLDETTREIIVGGSTMSI